jgi:1-deoxy-D-xylulose-5-phosphate reductoisomerase
METVDLSCCGWNMLEKSHRTRVGERRRVTILGATGSVGQQTIDLLESDLDSFEVVALTANTNVERLAAQARHLRAEFAAVADQRHYLALKSALAGTDTEVGAGDDAIVEAACRDSEWVMSAIVGVAGLPSTLAAARRGAAIAFANKETLVCAGPLMMDLVAEAGARLLPADSEHNAIWQVLDTNQRDAVARLVITASGGPFRTMSRDEMRSASPEHALRHPVWNMGAKISIDSATLMNKALEVIEAHFLFQVPSSKIDVLIHPQSVIHSLVEYTDGSVLAQLGTPDMRIPIASTLAWPSRMSTSVERLDLVRIGKLTFENPDPEKFPALRFARVALERGGTAPAALNAANEIAVQAFLDKQIGFLDIERVNEQALDEIPVLPLTDLETVLEIDRQARFLARRIVESLRG